MLSPAQLLTLLPFLIASTSSQSTYPQFTSETRCDGLVRPSYSDCDTIAAEQIPDVVRAGPGLLAGAVFTYGKCQVRFIACDAAAAEFESTKQTVTELMKIVKDTCGAANAGGAHRYGQACLVVEDPGNEFGRGGLGRRDDGTEALGFQKRQSGGDVPGQTRGSIQSGGDTPGQTGGPVQSGGDIPVQTRGPIQSGGDSPVQTGPAQSGGDFPVQTGVPIFEKRQSNQGRVPDVEKKQLVETPSVWIVRPTGSLEFQKRQVNQSTSLGTQRRWSNQTNIENVERRQGNQTDIDNLERRQSNQTGAPDLQRRQSNHTGAPDLGRRQSNQTGAPNVEMRQINGALPSISGKRQTNTTLVAKSFGSPLSERQCNPPSDPCFTYTELTFTQNSRGDPVRVCNNVLPDGAACSESRAETVSQQIDVGINVGATIAEVISVGGSFTQSSGESSTETLSTTITINCKDGSKAGYVVWYPFFEVSTGRCGRGKTGSCAGVCYAEEEASCTMKRPIVSGFGSLAGEYGVQCI